MISYNWESKSLCVLDQDMVSFLSHLYRETRYLENVPEKAIKHRLHGLVANIVTIQADGRPSFKVPNNEHGISFVDLLAEMEIRDWCKKPWLSEELERYANIITKSRMTIISKKINELKGAKCLFKFTQSKHAKDIVDGRIRMKSAKSYNKEGYNIAIRDNELKIQHQVKGLRVIMPDGSSLPISGDRISANAAGDYYVSCFSVDFSLKFFPLFESDCCVVIKNADRYVELVKDTCKNLLPDHEVLFGEVEYVDIHRRFNSKKPIEFRKMSNFSYEKEWRFVIYPKFARFEDLEEEVVTVQIDSRKLDVLVINL
ncbi:hypothetical protein [Billgrantia aerodenitrificans]|uniref:Uncharacterized protein n=1 Tax=Billgrantia aerodenitrificans TaxID=2733483 RepID=A0ABS9AME8_9GAMM|nr:hypothetical protein [Halomonas aerodenitrificans]MCE8022876.1 hypothetical protein [Halomonas aerodenitrificans]